MTTTHFQFRSFNQAYDGHHAFPAGLGDADKKTLCDHGPNVNGDWYLAGQESDSGAANKFAVQIRCKVQGIAPGLQVELTGTPNDRQKLHRIAVELRKLEKKSPV